MLFDIVIQLNIIPANFEYFWRIAMYLKCTNVR